MVRTVKVFLAGTYSENKNAEDILKSWYNLESYYYIKPWQYELIKKSKMFLLDSGAFTFCGNKKDIDWNIYLERYAEFIKQHDVRYFFELDIDSIIGYERVVNLRNRLEKMTSRQCIPVWHISRGKDEFLRLCEEYKYVALGGYVAAIKANDKRQQAYIKAYNWFIDQAHKRNTQIHGLGFTNVSKFRNIHFDSVDSTRWNCARFGRIEYFDGKTMRAIDKRAEGKRLASGKNAEIVKYTFNEWVKFQKYADTHY